MNETCRSARDVSEPESLWQQTVLLAAVSLLTVLSAVGAAGPSERPGAANGDTNHSLNLAAALEASQSADDSLGSTGVLLDFGLSEINSREDQPQTLLPAITLNRPGSRLPGPLDLDRPMHGLFPSQPDGGLSKSRWGIRWRLSLVESADRDGQV